jgi:hypothetical protein
MWTGELIGPTTEVFSSLPSYAVNAVWVGRLDRTRRPSPLLGLAVLRCSRLCGVGPPRAAPRAANVAGPGDAVQRFSPGTHDGSAAIAVLMRDLRPGIAQSGIRVRPPVMRRSRRAMMSMEHLVND